MRISGTGVEDRGEVYSPGPKSKPCRTFRYWVSVPVIQAIAEGGDSLVELEASDTVEYKRNSEDGGSPGSSWNSDCISLARNAVQSAELTWGILSDWSEYLLSPPTTLPARPG